MAKKKKISKTESEAKLRKNFYTFQKKVNRLEEIKHELNSLEKGGYTKGFEKEVAIIRSRLKDTTAIPTLIKKLNKLRGEIRNKRLVKKKSPINRIQNRVSKIDTNIEDTRRKIENRVARVDSHLEDSQKELKNEIKNLKLQLDKSLEKKKSVDSHVGFVVDEGFEGFLKDVKMDLSERVKFKEAQLNDQLRKDLDLRKRALEGEYKSMEEKLTSDFENKEKRLKQSYELRVQNNLKKEISERFTEELRKKFDAERDKIDATYISQLKNKYHGEYVKQRKRLEERFRVKIDKEIKNIENEHKANENSAKLKIQKKLNVIDARRKSLENRLMKEFSAIGFEKEQQRLILKNKIKALEDEREKHKITLKSNLDMIARQKEIAISKIKKESNKYGKELSKEHHNRLEKEIVSYRAKINEQLKKEFNEKMNRFVNAQKIEKDKVIKERLARLMKQLSHQNQVNELLKENVSHKDFQLEQMKQRNSELVNHEVAIKNEEVKKYQAAQQALIQKHKTDIAKLTNDLESDFKKKFSEELNNRIQNEKSLLNKEYEHQKAELANKSKTASFLQRVAYRQDLKKKYDKMYKRNVSVINKKLREQLQKEFKSRAERALQDERKKLSLKISELENEKSQLAVEMQRKLSLKINKILTDEKIKHDADIATRTNQLSEALTNQRQINDLLRGKVSSEEIALRKVREEARKEAEKRKLELERKLAHEKMISEREREEKKRVIEKEREEQKRILEIERETQRKILEREKESQRKNLEQKKAETNALLQKKEMELSRERQLRESSLERSKSKSREILEKQRRENVGLLANLTKIKHANELEKHEQKRKFLEQHKKEMQGLTDKLKSDYNKKFENEIKLHINDENIKLRELMKTDLEKAKSRLKLVSRKDSREYKHKLNGYYEQKLRQSIEKEKRRIRERLHKEFHDESLKSFDSEKKKLQNRLKEFESKYKSQQEVLKIKEKNLIEANHTRNIELANEREGFANKLNLMKKKEDLIIKKERVRLQKEITEKENKKMLEVLKKREDLLKARYSKEFEEKLKEAHAAQEAEITRKKAELAEELRKSASAFLN